MENRSFEGTTIQGRSNDFMRQFGGKCIAPRELAMWASSTKEGIQIHASQDETTALRAAHMTDHFCFDCSNQIIAYIDESDLEHAIRTIAGNGTELKKLTRSSPPPVPP